MVCHHVGRALPLGRPLWMGLGLQWDDVAFFANAEGKITHVGVCDGDGQVIHASGEVRIDVLKGEGLHRHEDDVKSHHVAGIRRWTRTLS